MTNKRGSSYAGVVFIIVAIVIVIACLIRQENIDKQKAKALEEATTETTTVEKVNVYDLSNGEVGSNIIFSFSKTEKNVVLIMLDRAISQYFPYIMEELPETKEQYRGFTFYPNTLSFAGNTIFASAAIFGGYEYTPEEFNKRINEKLEDKQNEALKVLPTIFADNGYSVTVCDPPLAGYKWTPDLTIFEGIKNCNTYNTIGMYDEKYSVNGNQFLQNYYVLKELPNMTNTKNTKGAYITITNEAPHRATILSLPTYEPGLTTNNWKVSKKKTLPDGTSMTLSTSVQETHYHVLAASLIQLGNWFEYLRNIGVYDNTKIIITSDHGYGINQEGGFSMASYDTAYFNPLLLVKDFDSDFEYKTDNSLMTNADAAIFATDGVIENATNPFTGKVLKDSVYKEEVHIMRNTHWTIEENLGNVFGSVKYFTVKDNIFDQNNWGNITINPPTSVETTTTKSDEEK